MLRRRLDVLYRNRRKVVALDPHIDDRESVYPCAFSSASRSSTGVRASNPAPPHSRARLAYAKAEYRATRAARRPAERCPSAIVDDQTIGLVRMRARANFRSRHLKTRRRRIARSGAVPSRAARPSRPAPESHRGVNPCARYVPPARHPDVEAAEQLSPDSATTRMPFVLGEEVIHRAKDIGHLDCGVRCARFPAADCRRTAPSRDASAGLLEQRADENRARRRRYTCDASHQLCDRPPTRCDPG